MTYDECPCVPAGQCNEVTHKEVKALSEQLYADDNNNVYGALRVTVDPGERQR